MSITLSKNLEKIAPSATVAMTQLARDLKNQGKDVISLSAGEPDFDTPENIKKAAIDAITRGETKYTAVDGIDELKEAIIEKFSRDNNLDFLKENISVAPGGKTIIYNAMVATLNPRDEVIIPKPFWVSYPDIVKLAGGTPITIETSRNRNFKITADDLEKNITKNTKWIIINSPSNPTGEVYSSEELQSLANVLKKYPNIYILSDDIYEHLLYEKKEKFTTIGEIDDEINSRTLTMNGVSKAYSMTGWRIGYCGGPKKIIDSMRKLQGQSTSNPSSISQWAAVEALNGDQSFLKDWLDSFEMRRNKVVEMINSAEGLSCLKPKGAFYVYPSCEDVIGKKLISGEEIKNDEDFAMNLLRNKSVGVVHGSAFGLSPYFRISYATSIEKLEEACKRIIDFCDELE
ncbi:MAG: pyridoxal phosphate-dependent aminotransferase [Pseudomonadota bacterium]|nr:pyridoxal phosphate-dependent aminotransferase [Pseudomonadota bacterium]MEC8020287.1 pyridoxal phosphate-dependent aminotransferase [Pseudomonadota bacterium]